MPKGRPAKACLCQKASEPAPPQPPQPPPPPPPPPPSLPPPSCHHEYSGVRLKHWPLPGTLFVHRITQGTLPHTHTHTHTHTHMDTHAHASSLCVARATRLNIMSSVRMQGEGPRQSAGRGSHPEYQGFLIFFSKGT